MPEHERHSAPLNDAWQRAHAQAIQLARYAERMSSRWVLGNIGVVVAALLFLVTALVLSATSIHMLGIKTRADHAEAVTRECALLMQELGESNVAARSMIVLGDPALLRLRATNKKHIEARFSHLSILVSDNPQILRLVKAAESFATIRLELYDELVRQGGTTDAGNEPRRLRFTRTSNEEIAKISAWAGQTYISDQQHLASEMHLSIVLALTAGLASPLFGLIGIHLLRRERENQEARELQFELAHVQRLAIMGETSTMLAHEINQPLAAASNYLSVARRHLDSDGADKARTILDRVEQQLQRASAIVRKLRRFIEKREAERSVESPDALVEDTIVLLGTIDPTVNLKTKIAPNLPPLLVDRVQVQQVLVNLMRNAIEAMQGSAQRELVLSMTYEGGKTIQVTLADTGPGLSPEVVARLFQPFVSTKAGGMGVGLSICQSIVLQHGGRIWAEANPHGGTIFVFTLPIAAARAAA